MGPIQPQNRKYLCQAPRPEVWADISKQVLSEIGRNEIVATIEQIQTLHSIEPRVGPGRKSNAEHALQFYRYLLQEIDNDDEDNDAAETGEEPPEETSDPPAEPKPRSTSCEICTLSNSPLIPCSTCHLVFHSDCLRPKVPAADDEAWRCPYCIMADASIKRSSRARKQATASVRQMARLKNQLERERAAATLSVAANEGPTTGTPHDAAEPNVVPDTQAPAETAEKVVAAETKVETDTAGKESTKSEVKPEETKDSAQPKTEVNPETSNAHAKVTVTNEAASKDDPPAPSTTSEPLATTDVEANKEKEEEAAAKREMELGPSSPARSRRNRKQPTLYDPQLGPASQWSSDGRVPLRADNSDDEVSDEEEEDEEEKGQTKELLRRQSREGGDDSPWCNFCKDRSDIPLCVFCGCRLCFGKHDKEKMLSCTDCQEGYHAACLSATGDAEGSVEGDAPWRCPSCSNARKAPKRSTTTKLMTSEVSTGTTSANPSRRSTRNPVQRRPLPIASSEPMTVESERQPAPSTSKPTGRPRGRPPKNASAVPLISTQSVLPAPSRKRGRLPSNPQGGPPRKRGRPPSAATLARRAEEEEHRRRQRAESATTDEMDVETEGISPSVTVSRSGRTVKRSSFHDEIAEGAQFMKSTRIRQSPQAGPVPSDFPVGFEDPGQLLAGPVAECSMIDIPQDTKPAALANLKPPPGSSNASDRVPPRRKPGARECMQMSRRFGAEVISDKYMDILTDYCSRGKVEHLIRMRERLDEHSRYLESQLAGLEALVQEKGESDVVVPLAPNRPE